MAKKKETTEVENADAAESKKAKKEVKAESESSEDKKAKLAKLKEKAEKLAGEVKEEKVDLKSKVKVEKKAADDDTVDKKDTLVPMEDYLKASIHLGTRVITPDMRQYVYRRRADGLAVFNTAMLDDKIREGCAFLNKYAPEDILIVCKREAGWKAVEKFVEATGIRFFTKKYPAGILTNTSLDNFMETELMVICDPWLDKNALEDAGRVGIPVLSVCDTNNFTKGIDQIVPGNNKSAKSLGIILYLLAKSYVEARGLKNKVPPIQEFIEGWDELTPPK
jgi:small subunit ribosomal protein S2